MVSPQCSLVLLVFELGAYLGRGGYDGLTNVVEERGMNEEPDDFDDSADKLWCLYEEVAQRYDEARIRALKDDMKGIPVYVCAIF
jgi:hypothetical protein